jgi:predicted O-methyltransferase YrrM
MSAAPAGVDYAALMRLREVLGPYYGSEDLCVLFYSLIKRERPEVVVELGTGLGICSLWMAQAVRENGVGHVYTIDDGRQFAAMAEYLRQHADELEGLIGPADWASHGAYLHKLFAGHAPNITARAAELTLNSDAVLLPEACDFCGKPIDLLFADFRHDPYAIMDILAFFLPRLSPCASIFIDSASTSRVTFSMLEQLVAQLNASKIPQRFLTAMPLEHRQALCDLVPRRQFRLMHLVERKMRPQNSTAWLRIEPVDWQPHPVTMLH